MAEAPDTSAGEIGRLQGQIREFAHERDWEQFHTPKNLVLAVVGEVGELAEIFQWMSNDQAAHAMEEVSLAGRVRDELADVLIYLVRLADVLGVDLLSAADAKLALNRERYPIDHARGSATKYTDF